ncbi:MAG: Peptidyl-tRNA hydrolase [candidate division WS6 bacterium OLB20]|uniref:Peptidyl-tRNA hydrolase n=1 Tax=candidate division WS6 bacterium OLB20 TaxID=1617426 RepID=A0A136LXW3_9BACT|nr:MAG: Peptidyl-tRNA hydrolase [candidate division WS6 bacterium OLB20]
MTETTTLIAGLGNAGRDYEKTRHNAGFMFVDRLLSDWEFTGNSTIKKNDHFELLRYPADRIALLKPLLLMNRSGTAVSEALRQLPDGAKLVVAYDDLDIALGSYKIQQGTSPKRHNGINSVIAALGTDDFLHVRIGIENRTDIRIEGADYVLGRFSEEELSSLDAVLTKAAAELRQRLA